MTYASRRNIARRQKVLTLKEQNRQLIARVGYLEGLCMALSAEVEAFKMERPADLEEWIESIEGDLDPAEREQWLALSEDEREAFLDQLGRRINASKALLEDAPEVVEA